ncbi:UNVERIFIED_CONTAM: hypothetical protein HDU68_011504 [Siphonaria sp. JEL0065]|nr:hypothetical protein HDU68_011504 [Siphonaria sp. JEL0065]
MYTRPEIVMNKNIWANDWTQINNLEYIQSIHVAVGGTKLEAFALVNINTTFGNPGGTLYHYQQKNIGSTGNQSYYASTPVNGFYGWVFDPVVLNRPQGTTKITALAIGINGANKIVKEVVQTSVLTNTWPDQYTDVLQASGEINQIAAITNSLDMQLWAVGPGGLMKIIGNNVGNPPVWTWGSWTTVDSRSNFIDIVLAKGNNNDVVPFVITDNGELLYGDQLTQLATSVANVQVQKYGTDIRVFFTTTSKEVKYMTNSGGSWTTPKTIAGRDISSFSLLVRAGGIWELYGGDLPGNIYQVRENFMFLDQNCLVTIANQKACAVSPTETDANLNMNNALNTLNPTLTSSQNQQSTAISTTTSTPNSPNADCLTIKEAFPTVQFNIDCYNVSPNETYPVSKTNYRRSRRVSNDYIQFQNSRIIHVILPNLQLAGSISPLLGNLGQMQILDLSENQLTGSIPVELTQLAYLTAISLQNNQLVGVAPAGLLELLENNGAAINFGTNCLDNADNQKSSCKTKKKGDGCLAVSLDTRYTAPRYKPLWNALDASDYDMEAFDRIVVSSDNFAIGEYYFHAFRKYVVELMWCMERHPEYVYDKI